MKNLSFCAVLLILSLLTVSAFALNGHFVTGSIHTGSAINMHKGALALSGATSMFNHHEVFIGVNNIESGYMVWDSKTISALHWGVFDHLQLAVLPVLAQSTHDSNRVDVPSDLWLSAQLGSLGYGKLRYAVRADMRVPFAEHQNIPLHNYTADCNSYALTGLFTLNMTDQLRIDANAGGILHMDKGLTFPSVQGDEISVEKNSFELLASSALHYFWNEYSFFTELSSRGFLNAPPPNVYARENSAALTFGFTYQFNEWIQCSASYNKLLLGKEDETRYAPNHQAAAQKFQSASNYPDWKLNVGVEITLRHGTPPAIKERVARRKTREKTTASLSAQRERTVVRQDAQIEKDEKELDLKSRKIEEREKMHMLLSNLRESLAKEDSAH